MVRFTWGILAIAACGATAPPPPPPPSHRAPVAHPDPAPAPPVRQIVTVISTDDCGLVVDQVYFDERSLALSTTANTVLDQTAEMMRCLQNQGQHVEWQVAGHTDDREPAPLALSEARAHVVAAALVQRGVAAITLVVGGFGPTMPIDRRATAAARAKNRRVDFFVLRRVP